MPAPMTTPLLVTEELSVSFETRRGLVHAVEGVSLALRPKETVAVVGESGSGKSVTAQAILRLLDSPPARVEGHVWFDGEDLLRSTPARLREVRGAQIGMVFQEASTAMNPVLPVGRQIEETIAAHQRIARGERRARATDLLRRVGLEDAERRARDYPHQLSGGERQRAMIAIALAAGPRVLIADEPTSALDVTLQLQLLGLLRELRADHGTAILLITHDFAVVGPSSDRVVVMYAGQVVEAGATTRLLRAPRHPYTRGLLDALPDPDRPGFRPIPGAVPRPGEVPRGCRFHPRCPHRERRCEEEVPGLTAAGDGVVRCHFPLEATE